VSELINWYFKEELPQLITKIFMTDKTPCDYKIESVSSGLRNEDWILQLLPKRERRFLLIDFASFPIVVK